MTIREGEEVPTNSNSLRPQTVTEILPHFAQDDSPPVLEITVPEHTLIEVYKTQWADIHHSRNQDWELSKFIVAGVIGLSGLKILDEHHTLQKIVTLALAFLSLLAVAITYRHKLLFEEKIGAIRKIEKKLGVDKLELFESKKSLLPESFNTQNLLIGMYLVSFLIFAIFSMIAFIKF